MTIAQKVKELAELVQRGCKVSRILIRSLKGLSLIAVIVLLNAVVIAFGWNTFIASVFHTPKLSLMVAASIGVFYEFLIMLSKDDNYTEYRVNTDNLFVKVFILGLLKIISLGV